MVLLANTDPDLDRVAMSVLRAQLNMGEIFPHPRAAGTKFKHQLNQLAALLPKLVLLIRSLVVHIEHTGPAYPAAAISPTSDMLQSAKGL